MRASLLFAIAMALAILPVNQSIGVHVAHGYANPLAELFGAKVAAAGPAVRAARRTARRVTYYYSLPAGCVSRVLGGVRYSYCGGVYYQQVVDDAGVTAYIVVNP
ncbi:MAG: hypothetical protein AAFR71_11015 [Pseudomonadota bacterium]